MRRRLAWVFVALAVMLAVGFLVPLGLSVRSQAELRGLAAAQSDARGVATALAAVAGSTGEIPGATEAQFILGTYGAENLLIILPDGTTIGTSPVDTTTLPLASPGSQHGRGMAPGGDAAPGGIGQCKGCTKRTMPH